MKMTKVKEISWPEEYSDLKRIEEFLICGICYEYVETSVMTPCSHNYCSLCIRKYLHYKNQCPACFHVFFEKDLYINRAMDGIIYHFIQLREKLLTLIQNRNFYNAIVQTEQEPPKTPPVRPARNIQTSKTPKIQENKQIDTKSTIMDSPLASTSKFIMHSPNSVRSPKGIPMIAKIFNTPKRKESIPEVPVENTKTVMCPVCSVCVSDKYVNVHLDACLKRETMQETVKQKPVSVKRPSMPKLVLRVMKDAELRKKMKEFGLSTQGDRKTLENRFTRYSTIYNAESDKLDPRPVADLIKQCEIEEKQERKLDSFLVASTSNRLQVERNAKEEVIDEAQKNYRTANKLSFDKLIEEVRNRKKTSVPKNEITNFIKEDDETASTSSKHCSSVGFDNISESEENSVYNPAGEIAFQDSDSDESCPLQHYRSDQTVKYLSVNLNDSSPCTSASGSPNKRPQQVTVDKDVKLKEPEVSTKTSINPYEISTDESTDYEVPTSPILNKNPNRKRARLSNQSLNKSNVFKLPNSKSTNNCLLEKDNREALARDLCNSIINDFSCDGLSDDSIDEFSDKPQKEEIENKTNQNLNDVKDLNKCMVQKESEFPCDKSVPENNFNDTTLDKDLCNLVDDFSFDILNGDSSSDTVDISGTNTVQEEKNDENEKSTLGTNIVKQEKENDAASANEHVQLSESEDVVPRPIRKRNRPIRFTDNIPSSKKIEKTKSLPENSSNCESLDTLKTSSDGSLKRRRGRVKKQAPNHLPDELQNPPKRPLRRRQTPSDNN